MRLQDKVCVITGSGSGIGRAMALRFAREGAIVVVADQDGSAAEEVAALVRKEGCRAQAIEADITVGMEVQAMVRATVDTYGRLDVLINQAGVAQIGDVIDLEEEEWDRVIDVNLKGVFLGCKFGLRAM